MSCCEELPGSRKRFARKCLANYQAGGCELLADAGQLLHFPEQVLSSWQLPRSCQAATGQRLASCSAVDGQLPGSGGQLQDSCRAAAQHASGVRLQAPDVLGFVLDVASRGGCVGHRMCEMESLAFVFSLYSVCILWATPSTAGP